MAPSASDVSFDPYDLEIRANPYAVYRRLRDEAPLYYNEQHDFYAVSRYQDMEFVLGEREQFISGKGETLDVLQTGTPSPPGLFINEDGALHAMHRAIVSILFTPRAISNLEPHIRKFCADILDSLAGVERFDFVRDFASQVPMRVVGMLIGIPEKDQEALRDHFEVFLQARPDDTASPLEGIGASVGFFTDYIDWRAEHPSDDLMTTLLNHEFEDLTGAPRRLTREEVLVFLILIASAGGDTTSRHIGWSGKVLGDNPDQRRLLVEDPSLIPNAVEEILRLEPPSYHVARYVTRDSEFHGRTVPEGSALVMLPGAANRDDRRFTDPDRVDVRRKMGRALVFGYGAHHCLGAALARLEGRIVLEEVLKRFPDWEVDHDNAKLTDGFITRGWDTLPVVV